MNSMTITFNLLKHKLDCPFHEAIWLAVWHVDHASLVWRDKGIQPGDWLVLVAESD